ncbi:MAG TPA: hypothetical protein ENN31_01585 [Candidatus Vogelbacteria bacterium]|nr:hypothetical protein [Candidatus Vogelbacteria bacterium]
MKYHKSYINLKSPYILTCEHASDFIPPEYLDLGLSKEELKNSKDLYDPNSLDLAKKLFKSLKASLIYPQFSRLLIDANRNLDIDIKNCNTYHSACLKTDLLVEKDNKEYLIPIPGNNILEEKKRWGKYIKPYLLETEKLVEKLLKKFSQVYIFQIHSFYPKYNGEIRNVDIGVVHNQTKIAKKFINELKNQTELTIGDNKPWGMSVVGGGIFYNLAKDERIEDIGLDINNKLLTTDREIEKIEKILTTSIKYL